jgi:hypothetical protein
MRSDPSMFLTVGSKTWGSERERVSVNEVNSSTYHILLKNITPLK